MSRAHAPGYPADVYVPTRNPSRTPTTREPRTPAPGQPPTLVDDPLLIELADVFAELHERGRHAPCEGRGEWISENPAERAHAAAECAHCPLLVRDVCAAAGQAHQFGVWGGVDRSTRPNWRQRKHSREVPTC
ncbi:MAG TPA: WhiB family transcriptional regulator [Propionibacteriaceae bacterium]|nr:WhiB family transcriptional regulator [Propionibacteriaceae bacterium]